MNPRGGTEILVGNLRKWVDRNYLDKVNLIVSHCNPQFLSNDKPNVLWQHVDTNQGVAQGLRDPEFTDKLDAIVFVSNWQMEKYIIEFNLPRNKCAVIRNAVEPVEWIEKSKTGPLKLIYTSTPWRGLEVLLESFKLLKNRNIQLDVYSSTVIYGANFMPGAYEWLFNRCRQTPGINYRGYAANKAVVKACGSSHIFSYPSVFAETSCLAAIEAGATGCRLVLTDLGALPETCGDWGTYTDHHSDGLIERYAGLLEDEIVNYWNNYGRLVDQVKYFNSVYSWQTRKDEWINLIKQLSAG